ncbi:MAG TPA: hypothetical protein VL947_12800, partial [Cytophagales bacterium]|nr:hypothetical protein [Cytophagales bacterium]
MLLNIYTYAQTSTGKVSKIKIQVDEVLNQSNKRLSQPVYLRLNTDKEDTLTLSVNTAVVIANESHYYGRLAESPYSSFKLKIQGKQLAGVIINRTLQEAYLMTSDDQENVYIHKTDINNVICTEYDAAPLPNTIDAVPPASSAVYKLQSNPSSKSVAYLDFDGETVSGTLWANGDT